MIILSILIPTIPDRYKIFESLFAELTAQVYLLKQAHPKLGDVEILVNYEERFLDGGPSIGKKREELVKRSQGKYLCFLDDDDLPSPDYVETLVRLCQHDLDVITYNCVVKTDYFWAIIDMSLKYPGNDQASPEFTIRRKPWHVCPVRSIFAKLHDFEDVNNAEDWPWMEKVLAHCTTENKTNRILLQYNHSALTSEADKIPL